MDEVCIRLCLHFFSRCTGEDENLQTNVRPATKKIFMILEVLHLIAFMVQVTEQLDCGTYRAENGKICHMCNPGNYKIGDCMEDGMPARCLPCPDGTYQISCNRALSCAPCSPYCPYYYSSKVSECNKTSDIKCQCNTGFHFGGDVDGKCIKHKPCPPSQGVKMQGTPFSDTVCESCIPGKTFSNVSSSMQQCWNCTTCPTISECTPFNDTVCAIVAVKPDNVMDQHGLSIGHIVGIVGACVVGIIVIICVPIAVGYYRLHRNHPGKPRNPDGECPQEVVELPQFDPPEAYQVAPHGANHVASPAAGQVAPLAAIQVAPPTVSQVSPQVAGQVASPVAGQVASPVAGQVASPIAGQVAPPVAGQVAPPEANDFIYRRNEEMNEIPITEDQLDNERSTEGDTEVDAGPISDSDVHLHNRHFERLSERQDTRNHVNSLVSSKTELKQIAHGPRNFWQHEQPGARGQDNIAVTPNNIGYMDQHRGPAGNNMLVIPTEKTVDKIFRYLAKNIIKDFPMLFRDLHESTASGSDGGKQDPNKLIEQMHIDFKDDVVEVNYQLLKKWSERYGRADENFCTIISNALRQFGANKILSNLQVNFRPHFPTNGGNNRVRGEI